MERGARRAWMKTARSRGFGLAADHPAERATPRRGASRTGFNRWIVIGNRIGLLCVIVANRRVGRIRRTWRGRSSRGRARRRIPRASDLDPLAISSRSRRRCSLTCSERFWERT